MFVSHLSKTGPDLFENMKKYAAKFYKSRRWKSCREAYLKKVGGLCERCLKEGRVTPADVVHHKTYINENNINDPNITLNFDNLEALCRQHHNEEHNGTGRRYYVDEFGRVKLYL